MDSAAIQLIVFALACRWELVVILRRTLLVGVLAGLSNSDQKDV